MTNKTMSTTDLGGMLCRRIVDANPDLPLLADIWKQGKCWSESCGLGWYVQLIPTLDDVCVSGTAAPDLFLGPELVGKTIVVRYPNGVQSTPNEILSGEYPQELWSAIEAKLAEVEGAKAGRR